MFAKYLIPLLISPLLSYSQDTSVVVCVPGQCLQGYSNVSIGAKLSAPGKPLSIQLLPGQYTEETSPKYLHDALTAPSVALSSSAGFPDVMQLPLNLQLQNGLTIFTKSLYSGQSAFAPLPSAPVANASTPITAKSLSLSNNIVASVTAGVNSRVVIWESIPDFDQLPAGASGGFTLNNLESAACSPACTGAGICSASGTCTCAPGFSGSSCEECLPGFFGPSCQACPSDCDSCDEGILGTGRCLKPTVANAPSTCNCLNGVCGANGQCECTLGFEDGPDGLACSKCAPGFFLSSTGDCKACGLGCAECADTTATCTSCQPGFTQNSNGDRTRCNPPLAVRPGGGICPDGSFVNGNECTPCNPACVTCTGPGTDNCLSCDRGLMPFKGGCVNINADGICEGTNLIADNLKKQCDSCDAKCTSCRIPNFTIASNIDSRQCTGCIPGFFISNGKCVESCPAGTFVGSDNLTCQACDASCKTCSGSSTSCLSCSNDQLASNGRCVSSCPSKTFSSSGSCLTCHPDCASCSGSRFNQCTACPADRPVLVNGRCLPTCTKTQFFDASSGTCQACDSSCSSCSGSGPNNCLACSSPSNVLRQGSCVAANCQGSSTVIPGLGVCLSELVVVPTPTGTADTALPTVSGLDTPTPAVKKFKLEWWQILLMALGCAFIFVFILWCCRRRQKKKREEKTKMFAVGAVRRRGNDAGWRWKLVRWGEKLFGHKKSTRIVPGTPTKGKKKLVLVDDQDLRAAEEARVVSRPYISAPKPLQQQDDDEMDMVELIGSYHPDRKAPTPTTFSFANATPEASTSTPKTSRPFTFLNREPPRTANNGLLQPGRPPSGSSQFSAASMYSQMTGQQSRMPDTRQPVKDGGELTSKFSMSTLTGEGSTRVKGKQGRYSRRNPFW